MKKTVRRTPLFKSSKLVEKPADFKTASPVIKRRRKRYLDGTPSRGLHTSSRQTRTPSHPNEATLKTPDPSQLKGAGDDPDRSQLKGAGDHPDTSQLKGAGDDPDRSQLKGAGDHPDTSGAGDVPDPSQLKGAGDVPDPSQLKGASNDPDPSQLKGASNVPDPSQLKGASDHPDTTQLEGVGALEQPQQINAEDCKRLKLSPQTSLPPQQIFSPPQAFSSPRMRACGNQTNASPTFNSGTCATTKGNADDADDELLFGLCPEDLSFNLSISGDGVAGVKLPSSSAGWVKQVIDKSEKIVDVNLSDCSNLRVNAITVSACNPTELASPRVKSKIPFLYPSPVPKCNVPWKQATPKLSKNVLNKTPQSISTKQGTTSRTASVHSKTSSTSAKKETDAPYYAQPNTVVNSVQSNSNTTEDLYNFDQSFTMPVDVDFTVLSHTASSTHLPPDTELQGQVKTPTPLLNYREGTAPAIITISKQDTVGNVNIKAKTSSKKKAEMHSKKDAETFLKNSAAEVAPSATQPSGVSSTVASEEELHCYPAGSFYGLPQSVLACLQEHRGITKLYDWQDTCLRLPSVARGSNLIYSLPTSGGKTLVAEIVIFQQLLVARRDVLFILPFVSIVQEKVRDLAPFASALGFTVEEYAGSKGGIPPRKRRRKNVVYVATIEKANGLVNSLIELGRMSSIGLTVVDELHMLGDGGPRGATLESCLAKIIHTSPSSQLVGLSATLSNISQLASFLRAHVYSSDFRPVELVEHVKVGRCVYSVRVCEGGVQLMPSRDVRDSADPSLDPDQLVTMVMEVVPESSCLVFCPTKKNCQNVALLLAKSLPRSHKAVKSAARRELLKQLSIEAAGVCPVLAKTIPYGVAYHHSGLTTDERRLLEEGYLHGVLCLLACTSTLAAGVNLPAKRVILRSPYIGSQLLSHSQYRQMIGRAGRSGLCACGESILVTQPQDKHKVLSLLCGPYDSCSSGLLSAGGGGVMLSLLLTLIGLKIVKSSGDLADFLQSTLLYVQQDTDSLLSRCHDAVAKLVAMGYITMETSSQPDGISTYQITTLGRATYKGCLPVEQAHVIHSDLVKGHQCLVLSSDLHLLFLATPPELASTIQPNWMVYFQTLTQLGSEELRVAELVGVRPAVLSKKATGAATRMSEVESVLYHRFYLSLLLHCLLKSSGPEGVWSVSDHFLCSRGFLQNVISSTSAFASCLVHFTQELPELWSLHLLLPAVSKKLAFSSSALDLVPLLEIPGVKQGRARQLLKAGYRTPNDLAAADHMTLSDEIEHLFSKQAKQIITAAKALLADRAEALMEEAEELMSLAPVTQL